MRTILGVFVAAAFSLFSVRATERVDLLSTPLVPSLGITDTILFEGNSSGTQAVFTITLSTATTHGSTPKVVDLYVMLQLPDQTLRFPQGDGGRRRSARALAARQWLCSWGNHSATRLAAGSR